MQTAEEWRRLALKLIQTLVLGPLFVLGSLFVLITLAMGEYRLALELAVACFIPAYVIFKSLPQHIRRASGHLTEAERAALERLCRPLSVQLRGSGFNLKIGDVPVNASYLPSGAGLQASFELVTECATPAAFKVYKEGGHESALKKLGLLAEVQTGDDLFDNRWFIETDLPQQTKYVLSSSDVRDPIGRALLNNFDEVQVLKHKVRVRGFGRIDEGNLQAIHVARAAEQLASLAAALKKVGYPGRLLGSIETFLRSTLVLGSAAAIAAVGVSLYDSSTLSAQPLDGTRVFIRGMILGLPLIIAYLAMVTIVIRSRANALRKIALAAMLAVPGLVYLSAAAYLHINSTWDTSTESFHQAKLLDVKKRGERAYLSVASWREPGSSESLMVRSEFAKPLEAGQSVLAVTTRGGYFGTTWVSGLEHMSWNAKH
ncbi:MAG: hypothetical protein KDD66_14340 [Bdellovibrionales bacterium]|nr:hypothetical protein [Bdellovibrionales bacterium]